MTDPRKDLPPVNSPNFLEKVREALSTYLGNRGDKLDRGLTVRDLADAGLIDITPGYLNGRSKLPPVSGPGASLGSSGYVYDIDLTPPPTPTGFVATPAISSVLIECDNPGYTQGHGHARSILYGASWVSGPLPVFANAVALTEFTGSITSLATNPSMTWHLWLKWESIDGVKSITPAGGTNGLIAVTGQDVTQLLKALTGEITASELYSGLGSRIDLIDGTGAGSVNARVSAVQDRLDTGDFAAVKIESSASAGSVLGLNAKFTVKVDVAGLVSGYGLASTANNAAPTSAFGVRANQFFIAPPATAQSTAPTLNLYDGYCWLDTSVMPNVTKYRLGAIWTTASPTLPFMVQSTPTTVNGVPVPAGIYASDAFFMNGVITNAKIGNLAVDNAKISSMAVDKLTAGSLSVGQYIQSTGYSYGVSGWRINSDGSAEFGSSSIRGQFSANQIDTRGLSIKDSAGNVILAAGSALSSANITPAPSWLNSNVSLETLGYTGAPNATANQSDTTTNNAIGAAQSNAVATASGDATTKANNAANASSNINLRLGANAIVIGNTFTSSGNGGWNAGVASVQGYVGGAYASGKFKSGAEVFIGLTDSPLSNNSHTSIRYSIYYNGTGAVYAGWAYWAAQTVIDSSPDPAAVYSVTYDGVNVRWMKNGSVLFTQAASSGMALHFAAALGNDSATVSGMAYGAMSSNDWSAVGGANKPADNATVGATFGINIGGQITPANASTYIADLAVDTLQIAGKALIEPVASTYVGYKFGPSVIPSNSTYPSNYVLANTVTTDLPVTSVGINVTYFVEFSSGINHAYYVSGSNVTCFPLILITREILNTDGSTYISEEIISLTYHPIYSVSLGGVFSAAKYSVKKLIRFRVYFYFMAPGLGGGSGTTLAYAGQLWHPCLRVLSIKNSNVAPSTTSPINQPTPPANFSF